MRTIQRLLAAQEKNLTLPAPKECTLVFNDGRGAYHETVPIALTTADAIMRDCMLRGFPVTMKAVAK